MEKVVARYVGFRNGHAYTDGTAELLATFTETGGPDAWAEKIGNGHQTSTRGGVLKAAAILETALALDGMGITTAAALRDAADDKVGWEKVKTAWCSVTGQRSGITWRYAGMLAGVPGVKPDRMICRFVSDSVEQRRASVGTDFAYNLVTAVANKMGMSATALDHAIWRWQRGRE